MSHRDNRARLIALNLAQLERQAIAFLRQARDSGLSDDDEIIAEAARLMGRDKLPLIGRVFGRHFRPTDPV